MPRQKTMSVCVQSELRLSKMRWGGGWEGIEVWMSEIKKKEVRYELEPP